MPVHLDLLITADYPSRVAELRLLDAGGNQLAYRRTDFRSITVSRQRGLFDLRDYLRHYAEGREAESVAEIGVCIAEEVLGAKIFGRLWGSQSERTLRIQLLGARDEDNHLAAALARVPWEIARPTPQQKTLAERNLLIRVVHDLHTPASEPLALADNEPLRVLLVFAEARGSRPLDARRERRALLQLFEKEIYPQRRVVAHVLSHGVTRERLAEQIATNGGYHIIHWSGHGHLNLLELAKTGGAKDFLSGEELVELFAQAGGLLPRLFFLGACHSGDILRITDWNDFFAVARAGEPGTRAADTRDLELTPRPGYTGTAHALLHSGVPSVVAMRYAVRDDYARDLAVEFYRRLLADAKPKTVVAALTGARKALRDVGKYDPARFSAGDHATPVLYGEAEPGLTLTSGRSPALDARDPRLHKIGELTLQTHEHFVGRTWELAGLGTDFISAGAAKPVAVIAGLGGMGKTALVAEALSLWATRFAWVLLYQAKPNPLAFEAMLRDIDQKLRAELGRYHAHVQSRPADAIHRDATPEFKGSDRLDRLTDNLIRALKDEAILLVLDNFETTLKPQPDPTIFSSPAWACQDPAWDACLTRLAEELVGTPSRVLITCRRPLAALSNTGSHPVVLGPLPPGEAALFLKEHPGLSKMVFGTDVEEKKLAQRLLTASRFHPLLMDRLARLATGPALRSQFRDALQALETAKDFCTLPALFAADVADPRERGYLEDALATSLNVLIQDANPDTRCLLWMIAMANDPVALGLLRAVWSGESHAQQQLRQLKMALDHLPQLPPDLQAQLPAVPAELRTAMDALRPAPARPDLVPLLGQLVAVGLVTEQRTGPDDENPDYTCHELVRDRIRAWMEQRPQDRGPWTDNALRLAYADWLEAAFQSLQLGNMALALEAGSRALIYCVQAGAYDRLGSFASGVVTGSGETRVYVRLLPHLQAAAEAAPEGQLRWSCLGYLADALLRDRPEASLPLYTQAASQARVVAESGSDTARQAWADLAWLTGNWATGLSKIGETNAARDRHLEAAEANKRAGNPAIQILGNELEVRRIDITQGHAEATLPEIVSRLTQVEAWWEQYRAGVPVPEAPDPEFLARVLIGALDIATDAHFALQDWENALRRIDAILAVKCSLGRPAEDIASDRMNRAIVLGRLNRSSEAQAELEDCLELFPDSASDRANVLSSLAVLFDARGDTLQAVVQERRALALRDTLPDPMSRSISHNNLANYLERSGTLQLLSEVPRHQLAALIYQLAASLHEHLQTSLHNYVVRFRRAHAAGMAPTVPCVSELLAEPAFQPLAEWLRQRKVDLTALQAAVDQALDDAQQEALAGE